jgi:hypothetical protein
MTQRQTIFYALLSLLLSSGSPFINRESTMQPLDCHRSDISRITSDVVDVDCTATLTSLVVRLGLTRNKVEKSHLDWLGR